MYLDRAGRAFGPCPGDAMICSDVGVEESYMFMVQVTKVTILRTLRHQETII